MENKVDEFLREFNGRLEELNQYSNLQYTTNGNTEGINLPEVNLWDDDNYPIEHFRKISLTQIIKTVSDWGVVAGELFSEEISVWEKEIKKQLIEKFPNAKMKVGRVATLRYKIIMSGSYNEDIMEQFIVVVAQDFEYMFEGCNLDFEY